MAAAGLQDGDCVGMMYPLTDGSSPGDWRLPTAAEWTATIAQAVALGCPNVVGPRFLTNDAGTACYGDGLGSSFAGVASVNYWSSSTRASGPGDEGHVVSLNQGGVGSLLKVVTVRVWPVRGGPR